MQIILHTFALASNRFPLEKEVVLDVVRFVHGGDGRVSR